MKTGWAILAALTVVLTLALPRAWAQAAGKADLEDLARNLEADAEAWIRDAKAKPSADASLKSVTYDETSLKDLTDQLNDPRRKDPVNIYVANRLLRPLLMAKTEVIRQELPAVKQLHARIGKYQTFPVYPPEKLKQYELPTFNDSVPPARQLEMTNAVRKLRDEKIAKDDAVAKHDIQASLLEQTLYQLCVLANDAKEDQQLLATLSSLEQQDSASYLLVLAAIKAEAARMEQDRAKRLYNDLLKIGEPLRWTRKSYTNYAAPKVSPDGNSGFDHPTCYAGIDILSVINQLAATGRMPAVVVPDKAKVDEAIKNAGEKKPASQPKGPAGGNPAPKTH